MMEPLRIVDVIVDKVGSPRGDGTAGSSLYLVPIRLSRAVTEFEALRTVAVWDKLKPFPYRHRPGTVTVAGDTVSFAATTIDEYREVHKATLDRVLDQVNGESAHQQRERETAAQVEQAHRQHVAEVAGLARMHRR
ncbi:hypothetical protein [Jatrophihabitans lederbergiae]|uniref:Uncharacterized protein n=1 Tax=Jatrophihabitans lederbergiae TaxID=3075547 RepID=A0ABU2JG87_9ACTN|nr:hypothetical protein [Jatrophihabitans sp. DSM 44399]MDT0263984.1 hypothetical protein [Jatrophihabitans sp. DSM 44399]